MRILLAALPAFVNLAAAAVAPNPAQIDFFEQRIRPVLVAKCYKCHSNDAEKIKGGLTLDTRAGVLAGGDSGAVVVPGDPKNSVLLKAMSWEDKDMAMPPKEQLSADVVADFEKWIAMGAPDPREGTAKTEKVAIDIEKGREFWAFQPPVAAAAPAVKDTVWPRTDVDRFILAGLEEKKLRPVADAGPRALVRRVYFDLIGLPPTPEEVGAFVAAADRDRDAALAAVVDKLLASPQFGERWGRHWLDVARYAESTGKERNFTYPEAWRYRDWVVAAVNADKPYDQFVREQIAGDLLPAADAAARDALTVATGFLAMGPKSMNERNKEQFRMDMIDEQIDVATKAVLGVTVACARCHDHKFDPIPQRDYYALAGIFRSTQTLYGTDTVGGRNRNASPLIALNEGRPAAPAADAAEKPAERTMAAMEQRIAMLAKSDPKKAAKFKNLSPAQKEQLLERFAAATANAKKKKGGAYAAKKNDPAPGAVQAMGVREGSPVDARMLTRGEVDQPTDTVPRGFVQVLSAKNAPAIPTDASGRVQFADWLTSRENPQTARVMVNRVWSYLFGQGIVRTPDNFGATGEKPGNPALLDTLAVKFMDQGWSVKALVRSIVLSRAYQLGTAHDSAANEIDPDNRLIWHQTPRRLNAEAIRDAMLAASGQLDLKPGEASYVATVGDAYVGRGVKPEAFTDYESHKRSVYLPIVRDCVPEVLDLFDFAEPSLVVAARDVTNVPSQALYLMNNPFVREQSAALAKRVLAAKKDQPQRIELAYQLALGRGATPAETERARGYIAEHGDDLGWTTFCQALFASAEFRYLR
ncbi:MAG: PSD1 and planctomycete cytochrome C domain-containing protein [Chthoniobacteraceae bacterium]